MKNSSKKWFALIQIMIAIGIFTFAWTIVFFGIEESEENLSFSKINTISNSLINKFDETLAKSVSGYSSLKMINWSIDRDSIPEDYILFFQSSSSYSFDSSSYFYIESQNFKSWLDYFRRVIYKKEELFYEDKVFVKKIVWKMDLNDPWVNLTSIAISFKNPLWNLSFFPNNNRFIWGGWPTVSNLNKAYILTEFSSPVKVNYKVVDIIFADKSNKEKFTIRIYDDNQFFKL